MMTEQEARRIAVVAHAANRAYSEMHGQQIASWDALSKERQQGIIAGVQYAAAHPQASAEALHAHWLEHMEKIGFAYGEIKSEKDKKHPSMRPWAELPKTEQRKDALFAAIVHALTD